MRTLKMGLACSYRIREGGRWRLPGIACTSWSWCAVAGLESLSVGAADAVDNVGRRNATHHDAENVAWLVLCLSVWPE